MKTSYTYYFLYLLAFILLMLLVSACAVRKISKTSVTTHRTADSLIKLEAKKIGFISSVPKSGDSIILRDRKTGIKLTIRVFEPEPIADPANTNDTDDQHLSENKKTPEYEFDIETPEENLKIKIDEEITTKAKTIEKKIPWYYKVSLKFVIWLIVAAIILFLIKHFNLWQYLKH
ncbi:MAG: hypothetical protein JXR34_12290 [Bacteroidales bacterium]|nr:hypothetical protein [Bacteroidales bacterium]